MTAGMSWNQRLRRERIWTPTLGAHMQTSLPARLVVGPVGQLLPWALAELFDGSIGGLVASLIINWLEGLQEANKQSSEKE